MKVRVGSKYKFSPCGWDMFDSNQVHPKDGDVVVVVNLHGCPPANTMGHCYVNDLQGNFRGMVHTGSLTPLNTAKIHERTGNPTWSLCGRVKITDKNSTIEEAHVTCSLCRKAREERNRNERSAQRVHEMRGVRKA